MIEMRNVLKTKLNKKGFTLAELLVVVAIIAILVAVSIPIFTGKLNEARKNTDIAKVRAAKAAAVTEYLNDETQTNKYYNADQGTMVVDIASAKKDGKGYNQTDQTGGVNKGEGVVMIEITPGSDATKPTVTAKWVK